MIVALDGPAGSGKTSTAKAVAAALGFAYLDTGAMYRAITLAALRGGTLEERGVNDVLADTALDIRYVDGAMQVVLNGEVVTKALRTEAVNDNVSLVSSYEAVREKMVASQRDIAHRIVAEGGGVVVDGRDIGTVVFPGAPVKVFMRASPEVRAMRRKEELEAQGMPVNFDEILENIRFRDDFDSNREIAPLRKAGDAIELDTSHLSFDEQVSRVVEIVKERQVKSDV